MFITRLRAVLDALEAGNRGRSEAIFERANRVVDGRELMNKVVDNAMKAIEDIQDGATIMMGGFGLCGIPENLIPPLRIEKEVGDLTVISNNAGIDDFGIGLLLESAADPENGCHLRRRKSHSSKSWCFPENFELELMPQGTFAERIRAAAQVFRPFTHPQVTEH